MAKGTLIIDKNGAVQMKVGANTAIYPISAMCQWHDYLIFGCGSSGGTEGNLAYLNKTVSTETPHIVGGAYETAHVISSEYRTPMIDGGMPDVAKNLDRVTLVYYDSTAWNSMTMTLQYRMAKVTTSTTVVGGDSSTGSWTTISGAVITLDVQSGISYKTLNVGSDPGLAFQFRITADGFFEIVGIIPEFSYLEKRQQ
jgi:hypothetical protein